MVHGGGKVPKRKVLLELNKPILGLFAVGKRSDKWSFKILGDFANVVSNMYVCIGVLEKHGEILLHFFEEASLQYFLCFWCFHFATLFFGSVEG